MVDAQTSYRLPMMSSRDVTMMSSRDVTPVPPPSTPNRLIHFALDSPVEEQETNRPLSLLRHKEENDESLVDEVSVYITLYNIIPRLYF